MAQLFKHWSLGFRLAHDLMGHEVYPPICLPPLASTLRAESALRVVPSVPPPTCAGALPL